MPLSEHEQHLFDQIEQGLYQDDPKFASSARRSRTASRMPRALMVGVVGFAAGLALVLVGLITNIVALSVVGFVLLVAGCWYAITTVRGRRGGRSGTPRSAGKSERSHGLRTRMEDRLRRRFDES